MTSNYVWRKFLGIMNNAAVHCFNHDDYPSDNDSILKRSLLRSLRKENYKTGKMLSPKQSKRDDNDHHRTSSSQDSQ